MPVPGEAAGCRSFGRKRESENAFYYYFPEKTLGLYYFETRKTKKTENAGEKRVRLAQKVLRGVYLDLAWSVYTNKPSVFSSGLAAWSNVWTPFRGLFAYEKGRDSREVFPASE